MHAHNMRAISSVGRAPPLQGGGHWFETGIRPPLYFQIIQIIFFSRSIYYVYVIKCANIVMSHFSLLCIIGKIHDRLYFLSFIHDCGSDFYRKLPLSLDLFLCYYVFYFFYLVACLWFPANGNVL